MRHRLPSSSFRAPHHLQSDAIFVFVTGVAYYNSNYRNDGGDDPQKSTARFAGLTYFNGEIKGVGKGTIVFVDEGIWDPATGAAIEWVSDPNSGTGDLTGLKAKASFVGKPQGEGPMILEIQG
jgi:hypothetical protein